MKRTKKDALTLVADQATVRVTREDVPRSNIFHRNDIVNVEFPMRFTSNMLLPEHRATGITVLREELLRSFERFVDGTEVRQ